MRSQSEKARVFKALHERDRAFIIPNPWDAGTARLLARVGFEALATTSAAAQEMREAGTFTFAETAVSYKEMNALFEA